MKKVDKICFIVLNILMIVIFFPWLKDGHYATDTYNLMNIGYECYSIVCSIKDGRFFAFLIFNLANVLEIKYLTCIRLILLISLFISNLSVLKLKLMLEKSTNVQKDYFLWIISYLIIYNFMYLDCLYFVESILMSIGVLISLILVEVYLKKQKITLAIIVLSIIVVFCYQGVSILFLSYVLLFLFMKYDNIKDIIKAISIPFFCIILSFAINFVFIKYIQSITGIESRVSNITIFSIFNNLCNIVINFKNVFIKSIGMFYPYIFIISIFFIIIIFFILFKENKKEMYLKLFLLIISEILIANFINIITDTSAFYPRLKLPIGALFGILSIYIFNLYSSYDIKKGSVKLFECLVVIYFGLNILNYTDLIKDSMIVNLKEKEYIKKMIVNIENYEKENNLTIRNVILIPIECDENFLFFDDISRRAGITNNACRCHWSAIGVLNFYTNRDFELFNIIDDNQINFEGNYKIIDDILYIKVNKF